MSWQALAWATETHLGSSAPKFILILLANKADENFSCFPSIRTLMAESGAGRSTVLRALRELETRGFITRRAQFHESGARRSTRYSCLTELRPHSSVHSAVHNPQDKGIAMNFESQREVVNYFGDQRVQ